jgi:asparagine synthase (glutamine-hydrolysing)
MSAFILIKKEYDFKAKLGKAIQAFQKKSYQMSHKSFTFEEFELLVWEPIFSKDVKFYESDSGNFYFYSGYLSYGEKTGKDALIELDKFIKNGGKLENCSFGGNFVLICKINNVFFVTRDLIGGYSCYTNPNNSWFTSSFLAGASLLENLVFNKQEVQEVIFFNMDFGFKTVIKDLDLIDSSKVYNVSAKSVISKTIHIPALEFNYKKCLENNVEILKYEFGNYIKFFDSKISSALSGGFDTRLMLASLLSQGVRPDLYVYGSEKLKYVAEKDEDVRIAKLICSAEGLDLKHIDKSITHEESIDEMKNIVYQNFWDFDAGNLFNNSNEIGTRIDRAKSGNFLLNGSGGLMYRNTWKWDFKKSSIKKLFQNTFNTGELEIFGIDVDEFFENIERKVFEQVGSFIEGGKTISRQEADTIFVIYRANFYHNGNTLNNYFGNATMPFLSEKLALSSCSIPHQFKRSGRFEADLIKAIHPKLASYPSHYGFDFYSGPNKKAKLKEWAYSQMPPFAKSKLKKMLSRSLKSAFLETEIKNPYVKREFLNDFFENSDLFTVGMLNNHDLIKSELTLNRIYSLELINKLYNNSKL